METSQKTIQRLLQYSHELQVEAERLKMLSEQAVKEAELLLIQEQNAIYMSSNFDWLISNN